MAVTAGIFYSDDLLHIALRPNERIDRVGDDLPGIDHSHGLPVWFSWDGDKLEQGQYDLVGIEVPHLTQLTNDDLRIIDSVELPRLTCHEAGLIDRSIGDVLRWARQTLSGRRQFRAGWPIGHTIRPGSAA
jgi:hypothetical protein